MIIIIFLGVISIIVGFLFSLKQIYQFQITEYRFDRFRSMLKDAGMVNALLRPQLVFPAKTLRNIMIVFLSFLFLISFNILFLILFLELISVLILLFFLNYILAKVCVVLALLVTLPFAKFVRDKKINLAKRMVEDSDTIFIGVTGSFGKSSVKEFVYEILKKKYSVEKTDGNRNTDIGVAMEVIGKLGKKPKFFVVEMGAYKIGEIEAICNIVKPKYGILCGIGNQHIDIFGSLQNLIYAKSELLRCLPEDGIAVINVDNNFLPELSEDVKAKILTYGEKDGVNFQLKEVKYKKRLMFVEVSADGKDYSFTSALFGKHLAVNILGSVALALQLGVGYEDIQKVIASIQPIPGKLFLYKGLNGSVVFDDGYNSNLDGFLSALKIISGFDAKHRFVVSQGIFELGDEKKPSYEKIVRAIDDYGIKLITKDKMFDSFGSKNVIVKDSEKEIWEFLFENIKEGDLLLVEGRFSDTFLNSLELKKYEE